MAMFGIRLDMRPLPRVLVTGITYEFKFHIDQILANFCVIHRLLINSQRALHVKRQDFAYTLPVELIASEPLKSRTDSRLMIITPDRSIQHAQVSDFAEFVQPGDVVVANNTRVFPARLFGQKVSGGHVEVLIERLLTDESVRAFVRASKSPVPGGILLMDGGFHLTVTGRDGDLFLLSSEPGVRILEMAELYGHIPLPPYIKRDDTDDDRTRYQTVFAKDAGAVAAPTAGLHLDHALIDRIQARGATWCEITLHVGAGTFNPVRVDDLSDHAMHAEWYQISDEVASLINTAKAEGRRVIAIGTTTLRCLEGSALANTGRVAEESNETSIFITPGYSFSVVDMLFTNFHLPESTLLMLVSAFGGYARLMASYQDAIINRYRFFSYGDACLITLDRGAGSHAS